MHEIIMAEGFELHQHGGKWRGLCPLHDPAGRNPSFQADERRFRCWSCGEHGDGPAFIMKLKGLTFPQALGYLGEDRQRPTRQELAQRARDRKLRIAAEWREREVARTLGIAIRRIHAALLRITPETLDDHAPMLQELSVIEHHHQTLIEGTPEDRAAVVAEWEGVKLFERTLLFNRNFDFRSLLGATEKPPAPPEVSKESVNEIETCCIEFPVDRAETDNRQAHTFQGL